MRRQAAIAVSAVLAMAVGLCVAGSPASASPANADTTYFVAISPCRVVDTRAGGGGAVHPGDLRSWRMAGTGRALAAQGGAAAGCGVPETATAVEASVSAVTPTGNGFLRAGPTGTSTPRGTVVQFRRGTGATNTGAIALQSNSTDGLALTGHGATTHVVVDVQGYYLPTAVGSPTGTSVYVPATSCRVVDTRSGGGGIVEAGQVRSWQVNGDGRAFTEQGGRPGGCYVPHATTAVAVTISAVTPRGPGFLRAWPEGAPPPTATVLQFDTATSATNTASMGVNQAAYGRIRVGGFGAAAHVVIDVQGYYLPTGVERIDRASVFVPTNPCRVADTRAGDRPLMSGAPRGFRVRGGGAAFATQGGTPGGCGIPATATAISASISAVDPRAAGYIRSGVYGREIQSTVVQFRAGSGTTNTGPVRLDDDTSTLQVHGGPTHAVVDVSGYFLPLPTPAIGATRRITDAPSTASAAAISADGDHVAFQTRMGAPWHQEVWIWTRATGASVRVSSPASEATSPSISADGRYVAFTSSDTGEDGDTNERSDVYLWDRATSTSERIYESREGASEPMISDDGQHVAFTSPDDDRPPDPFRSGIDGTFTWSRSTGMATRIVPTTHETRDPAISGDGRYITFVASVFGDARDLYSWDRSTGTTTRVTAGNGDSGGASMSADGRYLVFGTAATDLVAGDTARTPGVVVWDRSRDVFTRVGGMSRGVSPSISDDGRIISYAARLPVLDPLNPSNQVDEVLLWDRDLDATFRLTAGFDFSSAPSMSADGRYLAFASRADNLTSDDANGRGDVFLWDRLG